MYLKIKQRSHARVEQALGRTDPLWSYKNACVPCTYLVADEPRMAFAMESTFDGNESLKRMKRVRKNDGSPDEPPESIERPDSRKIENSRYVSEEFVDTFKDEVRRQKSKQKLKKGKGKVRTLFHHVTTRFQTSDHLGNSSAGARFG